MPALTVTPALAASASAVLWLLVVLALGLAVLPLTMRICAGLPDRGYGLSRVVGLVAVGWLAYLSAMLGFTAYVGGTVLALTALLGGVAWVAWGRDCLQAVRERARLIAAEEVAFLLVFGVGAFVRAFNPDIVGQEKFMDYAFMNALLRTTSLPAEDMWLSGHAMPYYYLGYLLLGLPAKIAGTPGPMAYNLAVVFVFASGFAAALSVAYGLVAAARRATPGDLAASEGRAFSIAAFGSGLLAGTLTMVAGNLVGALEFVAAQGWGSPEFWAAVAVKGLGPQQVATLLPADGGWWWRSSRVIANIPPDGITEFPYFSFLLGDLHPHYMAIPFVLLIVGLAASRWLDPVELPDHTSLAFGGVALATLIPASTWDVPSFWGLYLLALAGDAWRRADSREQLQVRLPRLAIPALLAFVLAVPYFVGYQSQPLGLGVVGDRTPLISMLILFGPALLVTLLYVVWLAGRVGLFAEDARASLGRVVLVIGLLLVGLSAIGEAMFALLVGILVALGAVGWRLLTLQCKPLTPRPEVTPTPQPPPHYDGEGETARHLAGGLPLSRQGEAAKPRGSVVPMVRERGLGGEGFVPAAFCWLLATWALCILIGTEVIFLRDVFNSRMNTVFKFQYHAWLIFGIASATALGLIWRSRPCSPRWRVAALVVGLLVVLPGMAYPLGATWTKSNGFRSDPTLMGDRFLERGAPADHRAIEWLRQNADDRPVVVEAVGGDYSEHARVSTFSGLPTIIGWVGHELQWRGDHPEYGPRQQAVDAIYRAESRDEILRIAETYRVRYVFFGTLERAKYGSDAQTRLDRFLPVAYSRAGTTIYRVDQE